MSWHGATNTAHAASDSGIRHDWSMLRPYGMTYTQCMMWGCVPCQLGQALWCVLAVADLGAKRSLQSGWFLCRESEMTCRWAIARMFQPYAECWHRILSIAIMQAQCRWKRSCAVVPRAAPGLAAPEHQGSDEARTNAPQQQQHHKHWCCSGTSRKNVVACMQAALQFV